MIRLFKKDINDNVLEWNIDADMDSSPPTIIIMSGQLNGKLSTFVSNLKMSTTYIEMDSNIRIKKKAGWKSLMELHISELIDDNVLEQQLTKKLSSNLKDIDNRSKPQKAELFRANYFEYPAMLQRKINGVRCIISWTKVVEGVGMFSTTVEKAIITSKEGSEYILPHITKLFNESDFKYTQEDGEIIDLVYDGELYIHGMKLNMIRRHIPMKNKFGTISNCEYDSTKVHFVCFDLAIDNVTQANRIILKEELLSHCDNEHLYNTVIINLTHSTVTSDKEAVTLSKQFISEGYEGGILRDLKSLYGFGKRISKMMKIKQWEYTTCLILDVIEKQTTTINDKTRTYIAFILKNDLNNESFECTPEGDEDQRVYFLNNRDNLIGKTAKVKFRERSGTKDVPFQSNVIKIND